MSNSQLLVGIIIVVNNRKDDLARLLESVARLHYPAYGVLVIDNGSTDDLSWVTSYPRVEYARFDANIGFVAGMVAGLTRLCGKGRYDYFWILDSDLEVAPDSLSKLVRAMSDREDIGVAGCIIYNTYRRDVVVEAGADVRLASGVVTPRHCNERSPRLDKTVEVDFIASGGGGSLIRRAALQATGFHDGRYHFLWEDTDFGLCLKKNGYRSVVVTDAVVYHPPFTEKRNPNIYAYYGVRNPLLTVAKYASACRLPTFLFANLSRYIRIALLMTLSGSRGFAGLTFKAIFDFIAGRFGKAELVEIGQPALGGEVDLSAARHLFILGTGGREAIETALAAVRNLTAAPVTLVVQDYRQTLLDNLNADTVVTYDDHSPRALREYLMIGLAILLRRGSVVTTDPQGASPLSYFGVRVYAWELSTRRFHRSPDDVSAAWKPAAAIVLGNVLALLFLPLVWLASLKHRMKRPVFP